MPHVIIEHASEVAEQIAINELVAAVHEATFASGLFPEYDIKTRAIAYRASPNRANPRQFRACRGAHARRPQRRAEKRSQRVYSRPHRADAAQVASVGVEILDMHRASYRKRVLEP